LVHEASIPTVEWPLCNVRLPLHLQLQGANALLFPWETFCRSAWDFRRTIVCATRLRGSHGRDRGQQLFLAAQRRAPRRAARRQLRDLAHARALPVDHGPRMPAVRLCPSSRAGRCALASQIQHVNVHAQAYIIGELPAVVVRVVIEHDVVAVPQPAVRVAVLIRGDLEVVTVDIETLATAALHPPHMLGADRAGEASVLPWFSLPI